MKEKNTHHPTGSLILMLLALLICGVACKQKGAVAPPETIDSPPSLAKADTMKQMVVLSPSEVTELAIETASVIHQKHILDIRAPGIVFPAPDHMSIISAPMDGRISRINFTDGASAGAGSVLFQMESLEFGNLISEYLQAVAEETYYENQLERIRKLVEKKINSESELERVMSDFQRASASAGAASAKLRAVGVTDQEMEMYKSSDRIKPVLNIRAPIEGVLDQLQVDLGQSIQAYETLARLIDLSHVMIRGYVSPEDGQYVRKGDRVLITRRESESQSINASISTVNPGLDESNRSVVVNILCPVENNWPKPGENVRLEIESGFPGEVMVIPSNALTYDGKTPIVFVRKDESTYEKRVVAIEKWIDDYVIIRSGLNDREEVAVTQIFSLKALLRYEQIAEE
jgi:cobalt-zinc-cadmium efflux system membrane fusion protein